MHFGAVLVQCWCSVGGRFGVFFGAVLVYFLVGDLVHLGREIAQPFL